MSQRPLPSGIHARNNRLYISYTRPNGTMGEKSTKLPINRVKDACRFRQEFLRSLEEESLPNDLAKWRLDRAAQNYLEYRKATCPESYKTEASLLRPIISFFGASSRLSSVAKLKLWHEYQMHRIKSKLQRRNGTVSARTINYELLTLRNVLSRAGLWTGQLKSNYKPLKSATSDIGKALTVEEARRLFQVAKERPGWQVAA